MATNLQCDIAIIGAGAGGLSLAAGASELGLKVVLLEKGEMGGDCLNYGCVPSKSLLAAAKRVFQARHSREFGYSVQKDSVDFIKVMQHVKGVIAHISEHDSVERFTRLGVTVIQEQGAFLDPFTVLAGSYRIKARRFVIASGSSPAVPPIPGLDATAYLTNETIFNLESLPPHLLVIGGGPIGVELAQAFAMLGSKVTLLEGLRILNQDDSEPVEVIRASLRETGVEVFEQAAVQRVVSEKHAITIIAEQEGKELKVSGTHLLIATGRKANIQSLNCENAGIQTHSRGIDVNARLQSTNKRVFAIGDAIGELQFTHVANAHAGIVLRNIAFKLPAKMWNDAIPWVTYTEPELAHVGLTEFQCKDMHLSYSVLRFEYGDNDRALAEGVGKGFIQVMVDGKGKVLGVNIVGHLAGELIAPWVEMIRTKSSLRRFTDPVVAYPTFSEISKRVASQYYLPKLFSPRVRKLVKFLNYFNR